MSALLRSWEEQERRRARLRDIAAMAALVLVGGTIALLVDAYARLP